MNESIESLASGADLPSFEDEVGVYSRALEGLKLVSSRCRVLRGAFIDLFLWVVLTRGCFGGTPTISCGWWMDW